MTMSTAPPSLYAALAPWCLGYATGLLLRAMVTTHRRACPARIPAAQQRGQAGEAAVSAVLRARFTRTADDVLLRLADGRYSQIDHLALTPRGILVLESKNLGGLLYGDPHARHWTQVLGHRRQPFYNPLKQNATHLAAVRRYAGKLPVHGLVVFMDRGVFPHGAPPGTVSLRALAARLDELAGGRITFRARWRWRRLLAAQQTSSRARRAHAAYVNQLVNKSPDFRRQRRWPVPRRWYGPLRGVMVVIGSLWPVAVAG